MKAGCESPTAVIEDYVHIRTAVFLRWPTLIDAVNRWQLRRFWQIA